MSDDSSIAPDASVHTGPPEDLLVPNHPLLPALTQARTDLIDVLSIHSPELMDEFLALDAPDPYLAFPAEKIIPRLQELTARKEILPVFCGAALRHIGTKHLMDYIGELLASPIDIENQSQTANKRGFVSLLAWKVGWDKQKGWMTFVRVYAGKSCQLPGCFLSEFVAGTLTHSTMLYNTATRQKERISKLLLCYASEQKEVESLPFGSVGVILGLKHTRTGDTLVSAHTPDAPSGSSLGSISAPPPTVSASVVSQSQSDIQVVHSALNSLARTDPSVRWTEEDGQTLVHGLGALHLEIVEGRLRDEFGAHFSLGRRRVNYKETFPDIGEVMDSINWDKDILGKPARAAIELSVKRLEQTESDDRVWGGNRFRDANGNAFSSDLSKLSIEVSAILQGLQGPLSASHFSSLPMAKVCVTINSFSIAPGSPPAALGSAASLLLRQILKNAGPGDILEPFIHAKVDVPESFMGKVVKDLTENGGEIQDMLTDTRSLSSMGNGDQEVAPFSTEGLYIPPAWITPSAMTGTNGEDVTSRQKRSIHALAPLSKMLDYQSRLRAVSGGQATFEMSSAGYMQVDHSRRLEILQELGRA
jgi:elongation factor G